LCLAIEIEAIGPIPSQRAAKAIAIGADPATAIQGVIKR